MSIRLIYGHNVYGWCEKSERYGCGGVWLASTWLLVRELGMVLFIRVLGCQESRLIWDKPTCADISLFLNKLQKLVERYSAVKLSSVWSITVGASKTFKSHVGQKLHSLSSRFLLETLSFMTVWKRKWPWLISVIQTNGLKSATEPRTGPPSPGD